MYTLTGLIPYTNYTVSIIPYNYNMTGPAMTTVVQQTLEASKDNFNVFMNDKSILTEPIEVVFMSMVDDERSLSSLNISWSPPTTPNGIITVYEIRYRESTSTGPYNMTNTTNTQYSIVGLIPNTSYTIGVRAYTSVGPGEWANITFSTVDIRKDSTSSSNLHCFLSFH